MAEHYVSHQDSENTVANSRSLSVVIKAANFAAIKHTRQRRKDVEETPYINHPLGLEFSFF